jgi:predicted membrane-bound dolichyl-phosphate-mannose-protein mannosyltransferase
MNSPRLKNEGWLYGLAFLIALSFRLIQLGAAPLTDSEATLALQAFHIALGENPLLGPQPGYILFTSIFFAVIEATNFMARIVPALVGSALVFVPYFLRGKIKPRAALILAFLFAFDPGLVALARQSGGTMMAMTFTLFTWVMWRSRRAIPTGIFAGLALLSGPSVWAGVLTIGLTWLFLQGMKTKPATDESQINGPQSPHIEYRPAIIALLATILLGGTLFFISPSGLSAWLSSRPVSLVGHPLLSQPRRACY